MLEGLAVDAVGMIEVNAFSHDKKNPNMIRRVFLHEATETHLMTSPKALKPQIDPMGQWGASTSKFAGTPLRGEGSRTPIKNAYSAERTQSLGFRV